MRITLSVATSADNYMDDNTPERLIISSAADWAEVYRLRAESDAILVGANTLRRDNPALRIKDEALRDERTQRGLSRDIAKVVVSASGDLDPELRFFSEGSGKKYVITNNKDANFGCSAEVIYTPDMIDTHYIITELERRGVENLFIEGGATIAKMFLSLSSVDTLRWAINPAIELGAQAGRARFEFTPSAPIERHIENLEGVEVTNYTLRRDMRGDDIKYLKMAIDESLQAPPSETSYRVGAVIVTQNGDIFKGYTHQTSSTHHAEQEAIKSAVAAASDLRGATIYSSMEPCSKRSSEPESCSELIAEYGFKRVVFAMYEPDNFVQCEGALTLRRAGIEVAAYPHLANEVIKINSHILLA